MPDESSKVELFRCPSCGSSLEVQDAPSVTCKFCGSSVPVPARYRSQQQPQAQIPQFVIQTPSYTPSIEITQSSSRAGCVIGIVVAVIIAGVTIFALNSVQDAFSGVSGLIDSVSTLPSSINATVDAVFGNNATAEPAFAEVALEFGGDGNGPGLFDDARNIAVDQNGNIFVADRDDGRLQKFDATGKFVALYTIPPDDQDYVTVEGMAADYAGHIYVSRRGDILQYSAEDGTLLTTFPGQFAETWYTSLVVDPSNNIYTFHRSAGRDDLIKLGPNGETLSRKEKIISGLNRDDPAVSLSLAVDGVGGVYVASQTSNTIYAFDKDGNYVDRFGGEDQADNAPGKIQSPGAIAVDGRNRLIISTFGNINVYTSGGNYLGGLPIDYTKGAVMGLTVDIEGNIYAITNQGKVLKYQFKE